MPDAADERYAGHVHPEIHNPEAMRYQDLESDRSVAHRRRRGKYNWYKDHQFFPLIPGNVET